MRLTKKQVKQDFDDLPVDGLSVSSQVVSEVPPIASSENSLSPKAVIGSKIKLKGELSGEEDIQINGEVEGSITLKNNIVRVGENGKLQSNLTAKSVIVEGMVDGDIHAHDLVTIKSGSHLTGNVTSERVQLDDGAKFSGTINLGAKT